MNVTSCSRYQTIASAWLKIFGATSVLCMVLLILYSDYEWALMAGIIGTIISLVGVLTSWLFKKYYFVYEEALLAFEKLPALASWSVPHLNWSDYQHIEKEHRKREYTKYFLWSPVLIAFIGVMIWSEVDDLPFDSNLIWWGVGAYAVVMIVLYFQMGQSLNKTSQTGEHTIILKSVGASVDGNITYWGKLTASAHDSLAKSIQALLFAKTDEERKVNRTYVHEEGGLAYVVVDYYMDENHRLDLFLPLPKEMMDEVTEKIGLVNSDYIGEQDAVQASDKRYNTKKYLKWLVLGVGVVSALFWVVDQGLPIYQQWQAERYFDEGVTFYNNGQYTEALEKYQACISVYDQMPEAYVNIGTIYMNRDSLDSALHYYNLALDKKPDFSLALYNKGVVLYSQNDYRAMVNLFYTYEKVTPENHDHDLMMGDAFYSLNLVDSAYIYYYRAAQENKRSSSLSYMLGRTLIDKGNLTEAVSYLEEAIQLDSTFADGYLSLSEVHQKLGNVALADLNYAKGVRLQTASN